MNGVELGKKLRVSGRTSNILVRPVNGNFNAEEMFLQSQANAFIQKPFSLTILSDKVQELLVVPVKPFSGH
jgi:response regulator RpfG family c-di-GMP phosphodiesterase